MTLTNLPTEYPDANYAVGKAQLRTGQSTAHDDDRAGDAEHDEPRTPPPVGGLWRVGEHSLEERGAVGAHEPSEIRVAAFFMGVTLTILTTVAHLL